MSHVLDVLWGKEDRCVRIHPHALGWLMGGIGIEALIHRSMGGGNVYDGFPPNGLCLESAPPPADVTCHAPHTTTTIPPNLTGEY